MTCFFVYQWQRSSWYALSMNKCIECNKLTKRNFYTYCSNSCQAEHQYKKYISDWKKGTVSGLRGIHTTNISRHLKRFVVEKFAEKCSLCRWHEIHPITQKVPLEIDHIDGNAENNTEKNLRLLCPNCHSLTITFRNLNKGRGRLRRSVAR